MSNGVGPGNLQLFRGRTLVERFSDVPFTTDEGVDFSPALVHLDAAGAYLSRNNYFVFEQQSDKRSYRIPVEPINGAGISVTPITGSPVRSGELNFTPIEIDFGDGEFFGISSRDIWKRNNAGEWESVYHEADTDIQNMRRIAYGGGRWVVGQGGTATTPGRVLVSTDGGDTWGSTTLAGNGYITSLGYAGDSNWLVTSYRQSGENRALTFQSADNADTFSPGVAQRYAVLSDIASIGQHTLLFLIEDRAVDGLADGFMNQSDDGSGNNHWWTYWQWATAGGVAPSGWQFTRDGVRAVFVPGGTHAGWSEVWGSIFTIHRNGIVNSTLLGVQAGFGNWIGTNVNRNAPRISEANGQVVIRDAEYEPVGNVVIACGYFDPDDGGPNQPRIWRSGNGGSDAWERMTDAENALVGEGGGGATMATSVAIDDQGNALFVGDGRWAFTGARAGLETGDYVIYAISYFNTHAGKFVFAMSRQTVHAEDGGMVEVYAPGKDAILAANAWMLPSTYSQILDDLRYDVYIQAAGEVVGSNLVGEQPEYTIRYAFTKPYTDTGESNRIEELPLGTQLILNGLPTTAVFEKSLTAIHNGRIWGMANQDEALWKAQGDEMSFEIANQANRFVLCYSEIGWANLMSDRSFIPIQPTQSSRFTGLMSTPSGLLVMFENEIFLVTGDPAYGNVSVELYLDMIGMDPPDDEPNPYLSYGKPRPCKVGGVPFVIWNGKLWVLQAGQAQQLAPDQWRQEDRFVRISPEPQTRSLLALTESGLVFRYILDDQFWFTDPVTRDDEQVIELLPNCVCVTGDNTRFITDDNDYGYLVWSTRHDDGIVPDVPHILWLGLDFGEPDRRHALYVMKFAVENYWTEFDRSDPMFNPMIVPAAFFHADRGNNTTNDGLPDIETHSPMPWGGRLPYSLPRVDARGGSYAWRFPLRETRASGIDVRLELRGMDYEDVLRLPIEFFYSTGGTIR